MIWCFFGRILTNLSLPVLFVCRVDSCYLPNSLNTLSCKSKGVFIFSRTFFFTFSESHRIVTWYNKDFVLILDSFLPENAILFVHTRFENKFLRGLTNFSFFPEFQVLVYCEWQLNRFNCVPSYSIYRPHSKWSRLWIHEY